MSNIVLYACLFEITCITPSGKGHDPLDDKKNMNTSYTMYTLKSKLLKKAHTFTYKHLDTRMHIYIQWSLKKIAIINIMYRYMIFMSHIIVYH